MFIVLGRKILPLVGHFIVRINCLDRALRNARATVDALFRVDIKLIFPFINTINWAHVDTRRVVLFDTGLRDDICHSRENIGAMRAEQSIFIWTRSTFALLSTKGMRITIRTAGPH